MRLRPIVGQPDNSSIISRVKMRQTTIQSGKRSGFDDVGHRLGLTTGAQTSVFLQAPQCPWPVRKRFRRDHCCRGRVKPGCRIVGPGHTVKCRVSLHQTSVCAASSKPSITWSTCVHSQSSEADCNPYMKLVMMKSTGWSLPRLQHLPNEKSRPIMMTMTMMMIYLVYRFQCMTLTKAAEDSLV